MSAPRIREMRAADVASVAALARASLPEAWTPEGFTAELSKATSVCLVSLGPDDAIEGLGVGSVAADELEIDVVAVDPSARRRGVGRALVVALLDAAGARGAASAHLEVRAGNASALALYAACGFAPSGRRRAYYRDGEDALLLTRALTGSVPAT